MTQSDFEAGEAMAEAVERDGFTVLEDVIDPGEVARAREALVRAAAANEARGMPTRLEALDPGGCNIRIYDLVEHDPIFIDLALHPGVLPVVDGLLAHDALLSNFTANIALPGSGSMNAHCDQSTVMPEPWPELYALNAIWCLDDVDEENGATRYLPGSHRFIRFADVPADPKQGMRPFEAKAGSVIVMHGRMWHTSGENRSRSRERAMLFAFYARSFLRTQCNWALSLSQETRKRLAPAQAERLGLRGGNVQYGAYLAGDGRPD
jgi:ectoine hydroxylase-related dioxygenase (phytanoyl-CoA dioxygenase family)